MMPIIAALALVEAKPRRAQSRNAEVLASPGGKFFAPAAYLG